MGVLRGKLGLMKPRKRRKRFVEYVFCWGFFCFVFSEMRQNHFFMKTWLNGSTLEEHLNPFGLPFYENVQF
jgi:hypothetical protein